MTIVFNFTPEHAALHMNIQDKDLQKTFEERCFVQPWSDFHTNFAVYLTSYKPQKLKTKHSQYSR